MTVEKKEIMRFSRPTLRMNLEGGQGEVGNLDAFRELDPLLQVDILLDWLADLRAEHKRAWAELWPGRDPSEFNGSWP